MFGTKIPLLPFACQRLLLATIVTVFLSSAWTRAESPKFSAKNPQKETTNQVAPSTLVDPAEILARVDVAVRQFENRPTASDPDSLTRFAREMESTANEMEEKARKITRLARELKDLASDKENKIQELEGSNTQDEAKSLQNDIENLNSTISQILLDLNNLDPASRELNRARGLVAFVLNNKVETKSLPIEQPANAIVEAVEKWQQAMIAKDPKFLSMTSAVSGRIREKITAEGMPSSPEKAVDMANRAYLEVRANTTTP